MNTKHTPGPWKVKIAVLNPRDPMFYKADVLCGGIRIAQVAGVGEENSNANARLISAAPELLQACKDVLERLTDNDAIKLIGYNYTVILSAAISKAE